MHAVRGRHRLQRAGRSTRCRLVVGAARAVPEVVAPVPVGDLLNLQDAGVALGIIVLAGVNRSDDSLRRFATTLVNRPGPRVLVWTEEDLNALAAEQTALGWHRERCLPASSGTVFLRHRLRARGDPAHGPVLAAVGVATAPGQPAHPSHVRRAGREDGHHAPGALPAPRLPMEELPGQRRGPGHSPAGTPARCTSRPAPWCSVQTRHCARADRARPVSGRASRPERDNCPCSAGHAVPHHQWQPTS